MRSGAPALRYASACAPEQCRLSLEDDIADWKRTPNDPGTLLRGARLAEGERWLPAGAGLLSADELEFVQASVAVRAREFEAEAANRKRIGGCPARC
jgi:hypothetical protein